MSGMNIDLALLREELEGCLHLGMEREALQLAGRILRCNNLNAIAFNSAVNALLICEDRLRRSASIKAVLPVMTGSGYEKLAIQDGGTASRLYLAAVFGELADGERSRVFSQLDDYCGLDTRGMIGIVEALRSRVK